MTGNPLQIVGQVTSDTNVLVPASLADSTYEANEVDGAVLQDAIDQVVTATGENPLATRLFMQSRFGPYMTKTNFNNLIATYLNVSQWGASSGFASLDVSGKLPLGSIPSGLTVNFPMQVAAVNASSAGMLDSSTGIRDVVSSPLLDNGQITVTPQAPRPLVTMTVTAPDWPWTPLTFAWVQGNSSSSTQVSPPQVGTGNAGMLTVQDSQGVVYGSGLCADSYYTSVYPVTPGNIYSGQGGNPPTPAPYSGGQNVTFTLYGSCLTSGLTYTYLAPNLTWMIFMVPAMNLVTSGGQVGATIGNAVSGPGGGSSFGESS